MYYHEEKMNLLEVPQGWWIAHCISGDFALGAGVAKQIDEAFNMKAMLRAMWGGEGAKRFARECGPALLDFPGGERNAGSTYSGICVRAYDLKPPIDAKIWMTELKKGMERAKK